MVKLLSGWAMGASCCRAREKPRYSRTCPQKTGIRPLPFPYVWNRPDGGEGVAFRGIFRAGMMATHAGRRQVRGRFGRYAGMVLVAGRTGRFMRLPMHPVRLSDTGFVRATVTGGAKAPRLCGRGTGNGVICRVCPFCRFWRRRPGFPCGSCGF